MYIPRTMNSARSSKFWRYIALIQSITENITTAKQNKTMPRANIIEYTGYRMCIELYAYIDLISLIWYNFGFIRESTFASEVLCVI